MKNCQSAAWWAHLLEDEDVTVVMAMTEKNEWSWRLGRIWHVLLGWLVICPALFAINFAVFALRGRWVHAGFAGRDGVIREYVPDDDDYRKRRFPPPSFAGSVKDSGQRIVDADRLL